MNLLLNGIYSAIIASITPLLHRRISDTQIYIYIYKVNRLHEIEFKDYLFTEKHSCLRGGKKNLSEYFGPF